MARHPCGRWQIAISLVATGIVLAGVAPVFAPPTTEPAPRRSVLASELGGVVPVIGTLGQPLGKLVTIEGRCAKGEVIGTKVTGGDMILFIESIDGEAARDGVWLRLRPYGPERKHDVHAGWRYTLLGYETGGFVGSPEGAMKAYGTTFQTISGLYFRTHFEYVKVVKHEKDDQKKPYPAPLDPR